MTKDKKHELRMKAKRNMIMKKYINWRWHFMLNGDMHVSRGSKRKNLGPIE